MSDINPLVIRTAVPFGYAIAYLLLLGLGVLGVGLLAVGLRRRDKAPAVIGAIFLAFTAYVIEVNVSEEDALDMNPSIGSGAMLVGQWRGAGGDAITLSANGTYQCAGAGECATLTPTGAWHVEEGSHDVELQPSSATAAPTIFSVVSYRGHLRLAHQIEDPDMWDEQMPFEYVAPKS